MVSWFRGVIEAAQDTAEGVRISRAIGRGVRDLKNINLYQQRGFKSVPMGSDKALFLQADDLVVAISTAASGAPSAEAGETVIYSNADTKVSLKQDGSIHVVGKKVTIEAEDVANILSSKIGLGKDATLGTPLEKVVTTGCPCIFGVPHPTGAAGVTVPMVPTP